ncbi:MAG TPA: Flp pilus assembly protein CpaB [Solirubrobacterales bacterium]|nr:Flp pilus assembly protein CpaB [Solirubrobacterales bacterium]
MSRRSRAVAFLALALVAAALAAGIADSYGSRVARGYGPLRDVVVARRALQAGRPVEPSAAADDLEARRVPARFVPAGALRSPAEAIGLVPAADLSAGSYLLAAQLHPPVSGHGGARALGADRQPVEISVSGAEALLASGTSERGARVDVVVTTEPTAAGPGRTYVAATAVPLLGLGPGADGPGPGGTSAATLALTRRQALRLIAAESFARKLTLLVAG